MALKIAATRRVSLSEFAQGWDECYLTVRVASKELREDWKAKFNPNMKNEDAEKLLREAAQAVVVGGQVIHTEDDGTTRPAALTPEDVPYVLDAFGIAWLQEVVSVSSGADRLKAMMS